MQSIDNVLWVNSNMGSLEHWHKVESFHKLEEFGKLKLSNFPKPFNQPDIVIFEGFYDDINEVILGRELYKKSIPYIIVPRSALTYQAFHNHAWLKKKIAHILFYDRFIKNSSKIQYLTLQEKLDSEKKIRKESFVLPNGFATPRVTKTLFNKNCIKAVFIGRLAIYQKGIDVLLSALGRIRNNLLNASFTLDLYGPLHQETTKIQDLISSLGLNEIVFLKGEVRGDDKERVILDSDIFVLTSRFEGHPMGLVEALAYGLPCVVTPGSNMLKEIMNADAGWCSDFNEEDLSRTFMKVISQKDQFAIKGINARNLSKEYDWHEIALKLHKELEDIIKE